MVAGSWSATTMAVAASTRKLPSPGTSCAGSGISEGAAAVALAGGSGSSSMSNASRQYRVGRHRRVIRILRCALAWCHAGPPCDAKKKRARQPMPGPARGGCRRAVRGAPCRGVASELEAEVQVVLATVDVGRTRLDAVTVALDVVAQLRAVEVEAVQRHRHPVVDAVAQRRGQVAGALHVEEAAAVRAGEVRRAVGVAHPRVELVVLEEGR